MPRSQRSVNSRSPTRNQNRVQKNHSFSAEVSKPTASSLRKKVRRASSSPPTARLLLHLRFQVKAENASLPMLRATHSLIRIIFAGLENRVKTEVWLIQSWINSHRLNARSF